MSVIGRLDKQVDALLITPRATQRPPDEKVAPGATHASDSSDAPGSADQSYVATAENDDDDNGSSRSAAAGLPIWML